MTTSSSSRGEEPTDTIDLDDPKVKRQIEQKARLRAVSHERQTPQQRWSLKGGVGGGGGGGGGDDPAARWPGGAPGQHAVKRWVVLDLGKRPSKAAYDPWSRGDDFSISFSHGTQHECALTLGELREAAGGDWVEMPDCDWHCVTGWTCLGVRFRGVPLDVVFEVLTKKVKKKMTTTTTTTTTSKTQTTKKTASSATTEDDRHNDLDHDHEDYHKEADDDDDDKDDATSSSSSLLLRDNWRSLCQRSADGYTAPVHREDLEGAFLAVTDGDGVMLSQEHGGPRLVFPKCYGWKSAKFLTKVQLATEHGGSSGLGFWEKLGCHPRGRWALNERWAPGSSTAVWNVLAWITDQYRVFGGTRVWEWVMVRGGRALGAVAEVADSLRGWFNDLAAKAEAWGERDRKWRRKRRKALHKMKTKNT